MGLTLEIKDANTVNAALHVTISGVDTFLALKSSIAVPLIAISKLQLSPPEASEWFHSGLKVGTHLPGVVSKGTWYGVHGGKAFFFFYSVPTNAAEADATTARVLGIEFTEGSGDQEPGMDQYRKLVIEVPAGSTAGEWKRKIEEARELAPKSK